MADAHYVIDMDVFHDLPLSKRELIRSWTERHSAAIHTAGIEFDPHSCVTAIRWHANESIEIEGYRQGFPIVNGELETVRTPAPEPPPVELLKWARYEPATT